MREQFHQQLADLGEGRWVDEYENIPVDIWGCGIILLFLLTGRSMFSESFCESCLDKLGELVTFQEMDPDAPAVTPLMDSPLLLAIRAQDYPAFWSILQRTEDTPFLVSDEAKNLLNLILHPDPKERPTLENITNHPWLSGSDPAEDQQPLQRQKQ
jgi:serine/threonine protein kinase